MDFIVWPIVVIVISITFMHIFRVSITQAFGRIKKLSKGGIELERAGQGALKTSTKTAEELIQGIDGQLIREIENDFRQHLEGISDSEKLKVLSRFAAAGIWGYLAINSYRLIFGSQIAALEFLNSQQHVPRESLRPFYAAAVNQYPDDYQTYSYDQWLGFLESQVLIRNDAGLIGITVRGQELLQFIVKERLSKIKAG